MEFCQRCGKRLNPMLGRPNVLVCLKCGYEKAEEAKPTPITRQTSEDSIIVIGQDEAGLGVLPTVRADCPKCDNRGAYYWTIDIGDEEETMIEVQVFRCTRCGHTWRERG